MNTTETPDAIAPAALKTHFDRALELVERRTALGAEMAEWREEVKGQGLSSKALYRLATEQLKSADQRRKAAEAAEIDELYRTGLGLPLFPWVA